MNKKNIIAIGGRPGTGKTSIIREFMKEYSWESVEPVKLLKAHYSKEIDTYILGIYSDDVFAGTDKLSMSVQPSAKEFIRKINSNVIFEGDRLFNSSFLEFIKDECPSHEFSVLILEIDTDKYAQRYAERGSNQNPEFLKSRETKIRNIEGNYILGENIEFVKNNDLEDQGKIIQKMKEKLCSV